MRVVHNDENTANYIKTLDFFSGRGKIYLALRKWEC